MASLIMSGYLISTAFCSRNVDIIKETLKITPKPDFTLFNIMLAILFIQILPDCKFHYFLARMII